MKWCVFSEYFVHHAISVSIASIKENICMQSYYLNSKIYRLHPSISNLSRMAERGFYYGKFMKKLIP